MGSVPVGVQCPLTSSLCEFLGCWAGSGILGYRPCWCPLPFPSPSISRCFSIHSSPAIAIGFHSCFFFTTDVSAPIRSTDPSLTHFLGEFPGLLLALVPDVVVPKAEQWCTRSRNLDQN